MDGLAVPATNILVECPLEDFSQGRNSKFVLGIDREGPSGRLRDMLAINGPVRVNNLQYHIY